MVASCCLQMVNFYLVLKRTQPKRSGNLSQRYIPPYLYEENNLFSYNQRQTHGLSDGSIAPLLEQ